MPCSYASTTVPADPDTVWAFLRDFNAVPEHVEAISSSELLEGKPADQVGAERKAGPRGRCAGAGEARGPRRRGAQLHLPPARGPFPFTDYFSTITVKPVSSDNGSFIEWWSTYDCAAADAAAMDDLLAGTLYRGGLESLRGRFA